MYKITNNTKATISQVKFTNFDIPQIDKLFSESQLTNCLKKSHIKRIRGLKTNSIMYCLFLVLLKHGRSIHESLMMLALGNYKTTINNFLNEVNYDWRKLLLEVAKLYTRKFPPDKNRQNLLIIDDTAKEKYGDRVEWISWFYDHSKGCYFKGYQTIIACLCNMKTTIPIDFCLKTGKKRCKHARKGDYPEDSKVTQRIRESRQSKNTIARMMVARSLKHGLKFDYILWDSWYNCSASFKYVYETLIPKGINLISMVRISKEKFLYNNQEFDIKEIEQITGNWKEILSKKGVQYKEVIVNLIDKSTKARDQIGTVKMCLFRFPKQTNFNAIISTDTDLTAEEILNRYICRWSIEVVIKDLKQYFGFNQSMSSKYAPQIADLTIKFVFYTLFCSLREKESHKSIYQLLFEFRFDIENVCIEAICQSYFKKTEKDFLTFAINIGIQNVKTLLKRCDEIIEIFFISRKHIDNIIEINNARKLSYE